MDKITNQSREEKYVFSVQFKDKSYEVSSSDSDITLSSGESGIKNVFIKVGNGAEKDMWSDYLGGIGQELKKVKRTHQ